MNIRSAKQKGRRLCQLVRDVLVQYAGLQDGDVGVTPASVPGEDIYLSPLAKQFYPFDIECKNQEHLNIWSAIGQAEKRCKEQDIPIVVFSRNRTKPYVVMDFMAFMHILKNGTNGFRRNP